MKGERSMRYIAWFLGIIALILTLNWNWEMVKAAVTGGVIALWAEAMVKRFWKK